MSADRASERRCQTRFDAATAAAAWRRKACLPWLKRNLFSDWKNTLGTLIVLAILVQYRAAAARLGGVQRGRRARTTRLAARSAMRARAGA